MWRALGGASAPLRSRVPPRARPGAGRRGGRQGLECRRRQPGPAERALGLEILGRRPFSSGGTGAQTQLGAYLERCGATWGDAAEVHSVEPRDGGEFVWRVDLAPDRLNLLRPGEPLESPPFQLSPEGGQARFQLFPKGDSAGAAGEACSLWLWSDALEPVPFRLRVGGTERGSGASDFCLLEAELSGGMLEVGLRLEEGSSAAAPAAEARSPATVGQSLQLTGLQLAEWRLHRIGDMIKAGTPVSSPPFRFHHVLLGDMYLELRPMSEEHPELCGLHFICAVPTMKLQVGLSVGTCFSKSFVAEGRSTPEKDVEADRWLQVNLDVPGALDDSGALVVRCALEEVVQLPPALRDMIPKLDERANWPKRL